MPGSGLRLEVNPPSAPTGLALAWAGLDLLLRPEGALHLPQAKALLLADFHLGKAHSFRRLGLPVPGGTTANMLDRLDALLQRVAPTHLVFLGDFLHSASAQASPALAQFADWRARQGELRLSLVRGNHDDRAGDPPAALGIDVVDEPWPLAGLALCHHPLPWESAGMTPPMAGAATQAALAGAEAAAMPHAADAAPGEQAAAALPRVAGHWHPAAVVHGRARDRLRLPCFCLSAQQLVLPAFGEFTGMHVVPARPGLRRFVSDGQQVHELA